MVKLQRFKTLMFIHRKYQNFGHKRIPVPTVTILWQGFLTMTFLGLCIEWKKIGNLIFGEGKEKIEVTGSSTEKSKSG